MEFRATSSKPRTTIRSADTGYLKIINDPISHDLLLSLVHVLLLVRPCLTVMKNHVINL